MFSFWKNLKMYTIFSAVQRQQRKSNAMTSFGLTACSDVYYQVSHCRFLIAFSANIEAVCANSGGFGNKLICCLFLTLRAWYKFPFRVFYLPAEGHVQLIYQIYREYHRNIENFTSPIKRATIYTVCTQLNDRWPKLRPALFIKSMVSDFMN
jgi:hypothetical protein